MFWKRAPKALRLADLPEGQWLISDRSGPAGNCVEVAREGDGVVVRDSKDRQGPSLKFTGAEWRAFVDGIEQFNLR